MISPGLECQHPSRGVGSLGGLECRRFCVCSVQEFMTFTSQLIVERSELGSRASVKEQGKRRDNLRSAHAAARALLLVRSRFKK